MKNLFLISLLIATSGFGKETVGVLMQPHEYSSINQAASAGLSQSFKLSNRYEYGGSIYQRISDNKFIISTPQSQFHRTKVSIDSPAVVGYTLVATYHTHPCIEGDEDLVQYFSEQDQYSETSYKIYGFMADMCTGHVHKITPDVPVDYLVPPPLYKEQPIHLLNTDDINMNYTTGFLVNLRNCDDIAKSISKSNVKDKAEITIEIGKRHIDMTCKEFERRVFLLTK